MSIGDEIKLQWRSGGALKRLLFINIGVFLALNGVRFFEWLSGHSGFYEVVRDCLWTRDNLMPDASQPGLLTRPWTVITYMFTHEAPMHIIWNMIMFWFSGQLFQGLLGERRLVGNYLLGGIAGFLFYLAGSFLPAHLHLASGAPILGASAAVMSVFIGIATYQPNVEVGMMFVGTVKLKYVAMVVFILDLIGIQQGGNTGGHLAHIGGALYGFLAARQLMKGNDWSMGFVNGLDRIGKFFSGKKGPRMRVEKTQRRRAPVLQDLEFNAAKKAKQERVDSILDKISRSGYDSLSKDERDFLFKASHEK